ncbi:MAG: copper uptake system-associated protein [Gallionella sp.]|nr:copper uptake system-associated protein [Gallionella sp.]
MKPFFKAITALLFVCAAPIPSLANAADETQDIRSSIGHTFDRPDAIVVTDPIVVENEYALAGWIQGEKGGRALLRKKDGQWSVMLCSGDGLKKTETLLNAGVPQSTAEVLAGKLAHAESGLPPSQVKMFGLFGSQQILHHEQNEHH